MSELTERIALSDADAALANKRYWNARCRARNQPLIYPEIEEVQVDDPAIPHLVADMAADIVTLHGCTLHYALVLIAEAAGRLAKPLIA